MFVVVLVGSLAVPAVPVGRPTGDVAPVLQDRYTNVHTCPVPLHGGVVVHVLQVDDGDRGRTEHAEAAAAPVLHQRRTVELHGLRVRRRGGGGVVEPGQGGGVDVLNPH